MPRFKEAIAGVHGYSRVSTRAPETPKIVAALAGLGANAGSDDGPRRSRDYNLLAAALVQKLLAGEVLGWRELRDAAWCLWTTEPALAEIREVIGRVLNQTEACERNRPLRALAASYMASFGSDRERIDRVAGVLHRGSSRMGKPWTELDESFAIFSLASGPATVAQAALRRRIPPSELLRESGLGSLDAESGFARAASAEALREIASGSQIGHEDRLQLVRTIGLKGERELQFADQAPLVADALTRPFGSAMPEKGLRDRYLALLLGLFGDPRLRPGSWTRMPQAEAIVRKWLTEQSLRQFLDVVDRVALERMWKYRRAFWEAVYQAELISDAWVVFDKYGVAEAKRAFGSTVSFAQFSTYAGQIQQGQAVLLLRIGRGVVAEWSHNGKCHIWSDADHQDAPILNLRVYPASKLRAYADGRLDQPTFSVSHTAADSYGWQRKVAAKIEQMTRYKLSPSMYYVS